MIKELDIDLEIITKAKLNFDSLSIYRQLLSYNDSMTFSVNLFGGSKDKQNIEKFFTFIDKELELN